jgi:HEAT repeat protein
LTQAARQGKAPPREAMAKLKELFAAEDALRAAAAQLAGAAKVEALRPAVLELASAKETSPATRRAAIDALGNLGGKSSVEALTKLAASSNPPAVRLMAVTALVPLDVKGAAQQAADVLSALGPDPTELFNAFLKRREGDTALAAALDGRTIAPDAAKLGLRAVYQTSRADSPLLAALKKAGVIDAEQKELSKPEMAALVAEIAAKGDPARGETVFRRKDLSCRRRRHRRPRPAEPRRQQPRRLHRRLAALPQQSREGRI